MTAERDAAAAQAAALVAALTAGASDLEPGVGRPHVTMAVPTRDGLHHLRRLFDGLATTTDHPHFDVVVVDNASTDGTRAWLADLDVPFDVQVIANDHNASFSRANNQALEVARGELFLALNNDVEPVHPQWLSHLVGALTDPGVAAAGPLLVYPPRPADLRGHHDDLTVQHAGIEFHLVDDRVRAVNRDAGSDPRLPRHRGTHRVPALTAACLLVRTSDLAELGGFDEGYEYGSEDWDLSLRLARRGDLVVVGRSVLFHHEYGTQAHENDDARRQRHLANHTHFNRTWGPALRRTLLLEKMRPDATGSPQRASITMGPVRRSRVLLGEGLADRTVVADEFRALGWQVTTTGRVDGDRTGAEDAAHTPPGGDRTARVVDLALLSASALPRARPSAGVVAVRATPGPPVVLPDWVDMVLRPRGATWPHESEAVTVAVDPAPGSTPRQAGPRLSARQLVAAVAAQVARPRFAVRACPPNWDKAPVWGDTHYARSFASALRQFGFAAQVQVMSDWPQPWANVADVVVHLRGLSPQPVSPAAINVLWVISHPELVTDDELADHDLVLVASSIFADELRTRTSTPVEVVWQATDTTTFRPTTRDRPRDASGIVAVAAPRWPSRRSVQWLLDLGWDFTLYGPYWSRKTHRVDADEGFVPNEELGHVYGQADIVVADQWDHMAQQGFVANRLFDVLAAGGFVISDAGPGVVEVFGDTVPTYSTRHELDDLVRRYTGDPAARTALVARAMPMVRRHHSFEARARRILDLLGIPA